MSPLNPFLPLALVVACTSIRFARATPYKYQLSVKSFTCSLPIFNCGFWFGAVPLRRSPASLPLQAFPSYAGHTVRHRTSS
jgi:hypothetical protein